MVSKLRSQRIADRIREELSEILLQETSDPRLHGISVTDVTVDRELTVADVFVSAVEGSEREKEILEGLNHAQGYLRHEISQRVELRVCPRLRFRWDPTFERAERIEKIIATLHNEASSNEPEPDSSPDPGQSDVKDEEDASG